MYRIFSPYLTLTSLLSYLRLYQPVVAQALILINTCEDILHQSFGNVYYPLLTFIMLPKLTPYLRLTTFNLLAVTITVITLVILILNRLISSNQ